MLGKYSRSQSTLELPFHSYIQAFTIWLKTTIKPVSCLQQYTWKLRMAHQCHWWARWPSTFRLLILNFHTLSSHVTNYQKLIFYLALTSKKDTHYLTAGTQIDNHSYRIEGSFLTYIRNSKQHLSLQIHTENPTQTQWCNIK